MSRKVAFALMAIATFGLGFGCYWLGTMNMNPVVILEDTNPKVVIHKLPDGPELKLKFIELEPTFMVQSDFDNAIFEFKGQRVYQYHSTGKMGYILRYSIKSKDPAKPLAYVKDIEREENGKLGSYKPVVFSALVQVDHPEWKFTTIEGQGTETWKEDGSIQCVGGFDDSTWLMNWRDPAGKITLEVNPEDGFYSTGEPMDGIPVHAFEADFYVHPRKKKDAKQD